MSLAFKDQRTCGISYAETAGKNVVSRFMLKYMHPCDALSAPRFKPPAELSNLVGYEATTTSRRRQAQAYQPPVRYYKVRPASR